MKQQQIVCVITGKEAGAYAAGPAGMVSGWVFR
jgi:hypothetical protein